MNQNGVDSSGMFLIRSGTAWNAGFLIRNLEGGRRGTNRVGHIFLGHCVFYFLHTEDFLISKKERGQEIQTHYRLKTNQSINQSVNQPISQLPTRVGVRQPF